MADSHNAASRLHDHNTVPPSSRPSFLPSIIPALLFTFLKLVLQAGAFFLLSKSVHHIVRSMDTIYDSTGRLSRSKFENTGWGKVVLGVSVLGCWHVLLVRQSVRSAACLASGVDVGKESESRITSRDAEGEGKKSGNWGRTLGQILVPAFMVCSGAVFAVRLSVRLFTPLPEAPPMIPTVGGMT